jgi:hypothetical protein
LVSLPFAKANDLLKSIQASSAIDKPAEVFQARVSTKFYGDLFEEKLGDAKFNFNKFLDSDDIASALPILQDLVDLSGHVNIESLANKIEECKDSLRSKMVSKGEALYDEKKTSENLRRIVRRVDIFLPGFNAGNQLPKVAQKQSGRLLMNWKPATSLRDFVSDLDEVLEFSFEDYGTDSSEAYRTAYKTRLELFSTKISEKFAVSRASLEKREVPPKATLEDLRYLSTLKKHHSDRHGNLEEECGKIISKISEVLLHGAQDLYHSNISSNSIEIHMRAILALLSQTSELEPFLERSDIREIYIAIDRNLERIVATITNATQTLSKFFFPFLGTYISTLDEIVNLRRTDKLRIEAYSVKSDIIRKLNERVQGKYEHFVALLKSVEQLSTTPSSENLQKIKESCVQMVQVKSVGGFSDFGQYLFLPVESIFSKIGKKLLRFMQKLDNKAFSLLSPEHLTAEELTRANFFCAILVEVPNVAAEIRIPKFIYPAYKCQKTIDDKLQKVCVADFTGHIYMWRDLERELELLNLLKSNPVATDKCLKRINEISESIKRFIYERFVEIDNSQYDWMGIGERLRKVCKFLRYPCLAEITRESVNSSTELVQERAVQFLAKIEDRRKKLEWKEEAQLQESLHQIFVLEGILPPPNNIFEHARRLQASFCKEVEKLNKKFERFLETGDFFSLKKEVLRPLRKLQDHNEGQKRNYELKLQQIIHKLEDDECKLIFLVHGFFGSLGTSGRNDTSGGLGVTVTYNNIKELRETWIRFRSARCLNNQLKGFKVEEAIGRIQRLIEKQSQQCNGSMQGLVNQLLGVNQK